MKSVVVVGAGIVGLCCAHFLAESGCEVTVVDSIREGGDNCSVGNSGMVVPSHFVPLASPGMIAYGLKQALRTDSPFGIANPLDATFLAWSRYFAQASTRERADAASLILLVLQTASRDLYAKWNADWTQSFELNAKGLLSLALTEKQLEHEGETVEAAHRLGLQATLLDRKALAATEPNVIANAIGGVHFPYDACLDPKEFMAILKGRLNTLGVRFAFENDVSHANQVGRRITSVASATKRYRADDFVLAAGIGTSILANRWGLKLPMMAGRGYSIDLLDPPAMPALCALVPERRLAMTPMGSRVRFGGTMELGAPNQPINRERVGGIMESARDVYPQFAEVDLEGLPVWSGDRPCTPDGLPYLGKSKQFDNLTIATGHAMSGVSLAPITGKLVEQHVMGVKPDFDHPLLHPDRYA